MHCRVRVICSLSHSHKISLQFYVSLYFIKKQILVYFILFIIIILFYFIFLIFSIFLKKHRKKKQMEIANLKKIPENVIENLYTSKFSYLWMDRGTGMEKDV